MNLHIPTYLDTFFKSSYEQTIHEQMLSDTHFQVPVDEVRNYILGLIQRPLKDYFSYLEAHPNEEPILTRDITQCGALQAFTTELCQILSDLSGGLTIMELGRSESYAHYLRKPNKNSWSRFGNLQAKTASQLGLTFKQGHRWYLSCLGYAYLTLTPFQQQRYLARALLRNTFYARILSALCRDTVHLTNYMTRLSVSSQGARSSSVVKLLELCFASMTLEGIPRHDLYVPKYNPRTRQLSERRLPGYGTIPADFSVSDDYFEGAVPLFTVKAACGYFDSHEIPEQEGWIDVSTAGIRANSRDYFIVHAKGDSMLPLIKNGDLCLFRWYRGQPLHNQIVLTQCRDYDDEYESSYTIKRFRIDRRQQEGPHQIMLEPLNKARYVPIILSPDDDCNYQTIGVFVKVLQA